jgi:hypothetical protein
MHRSWGGARERSRCGGPAAPYVLDAGETRRDDAILPFKALASDTGGLLSLCDSPWEAGRRDRYCTATTRLTRPSTWSLAGWRHNWTTGGSRWRPAGSCGYHAGQRTPSPTPDPTRSRSWPSSRAALHLTAERHSALLSSSLGTAFGDDEQADEELQPVARSKRCHGAGHGEACRRSAPSCPGW